MRGQRGYSVKPSKEVSEPLTLYSFGVQSIFASHVREKLCELEVAYHLINLSKHSRWLILDRQHSGCISAITVRCLAVNGIILAEFGRVQVPFLVDPNAGQSLFESKEILAYLTRTYEA